LFEPKEAPHFVNIVLLVVYLFIFGLIDDSIAEQQVIEASNEFLEHRRDDSIPHGA
jgi:hypothetical protein